MRPRHVLRLIQIQRVLLRHRLDDIILATHLFRPLRMLRWLLPVRRSSSGLGRGERLRLALQELGPIFVKFGQALATRRDLLPADIADELARLQDRVPPFPGEQARAIAERAYQRPLEQVFARFEQQALAAASIAQVHSATLRDGSEVVVKILRPGMRKVIQRDIDVLYALASLAERYWRDVRRLRPRAVVAEYEKTIMDELDLMREAANASQLRRNFAGSDMLYVPEVHWDYCRNDVLVIERIDGIAISDVAALKARGTDIRKLAENGVEIFFTQVFRHNFFHADMHAGNIFVDVTDPANPRYVAVDFGIVGTLEPRDQHYLAENFLAFFKRDYYRVARLHIDSGWVPPDTRIDEFASAVRTVCEPIFNKPLQDISFGQVLLRLFSTAQRFHMEVQPQLVLLQKTLLNIEGLGRELYPQLDIWNTGRPILEDWMRDRASGRSMLARMREELPPLAEVLRELPGHVNRLLRQVAEGQLRLEIEPAQLEALERERRAERTQRYLSTLGASLLIGGTVLFGFGAQLRWFGLGGVGLAALLFFLARPRR